ncbi:hypothetical protein [Pseudomonas sp. dw_358]|uniref:hypothetical protein n=1 Tax=Pseudomonas sp. dw_358 TaxID=2720083 RepID=UPI001BD2A125|nr:hypothetical protein [Pseudomonas sp. dw_358]
MKLSVPDDLFLALINRLIKTDIEGAGMALGACSNRRFMFSRKSASRAPRTGHDSFAIR